MQKATTIHGVINLILHLVIESENSKFFQDFVADSKIMDIACLSCATLLKTILTIPFITSPIFWA